MGDINTILDDQVAYGFEGGPEYSTGTVDLDNGLQIRDAAWRYPRHRYSASFRNVQEDVRDYLINVFNACRGKLHSFKFKDWNDFEAVNEPLQVVAGVTPVQLYKTYQFGQAYTIRVIQAVSATGFAVKDNTGNTVAGTLNPNTGVFVPNVAWDMTKTYTWTGEFYVWVHFTDDYNAMTINNWRNHTANVDLEEDKRKFTSTNVPPSWDE